MTPIQLPSSQQTLQQHLEKGIEPPSWLFDPAVRQDKDIYVGFIDPDNVVGDGGDLTFAVEISPPIESSWILDRLKMFVGFAVGSALLSEMRPAGDSLNLTLLDKGMPNGPIDPDALLHAGSVVLSFVNALARLAPDSNQQIME